MVFLCQCYFLLVLLSVFFVVSVFSHQCILLSKFFRCHCFLLSEFLVVNVFVVVVVVVVLVYCTYDAVKTPASQVTYETVLF